MKKIPYILAMLLFSVLSTAQDAVRVSGTVRDTKGEPVTGAAVILQGSKNAAAVTDYNGNFVLDLPSGTGKGARLEVSYISYRTATVDVKGRSRLDIVLEEDTEQLDEVVVVGYGAMRRSDLTGSVTSVKIDESDAGQSKSIDQLIQGHAAGVQVVNSSSAPDAGVSITIRGKTSLTGDSQPLYIIDGVMLTSAEGATMLDAGGDNSGLVEEGNTLLGLNPQDIASIEILKDASATAIYGSEGANGVVLITTKMAKKEKPVIRFSAGMDYVTRYKRFPTTTFDEWVEYLEANTCNSRALTQLKRIYSDYQGPDDRGTLAVEPVDWQDYTMRNTLRQRYYFAVSGHPGKMSYSFSMGYNKSPGVVKTTGVDQYTFRLNVDRNISENLKIGTKINYAFIDSRSQQGAAAGQMGVSKSMMTSMLVSRPYKSADDDNEDEDWEDVTEDMKSSPRRWLEDSYSNREQYRLTPSVYLQWQILPWLTYKISAGGDYNMQERTKWRGASVSSSPQGANASLSDVEAIRWNVDNLLMFNKKAGLHNLSGTVGFTTDNRYVNTSSIVGYNIKQYFLKSDAINSSPNAAQFYGESEINTVSEFARVIYNYADRYVFTGTIRVDGSSKFQGANKYATFPSFAFAWRVNQEKWFNVRSISMLKLRLGWGEVGNSGVKPYQTYVTYAKNKYPSHDPENQAGYTIAMMPSNMANDALKWETTRQWNAGVDYGMWHGRLSVSADAYYKMTYDLLNSKKLPYSSGFTSYYVNQGQILNRGVEFTLEAVPVKTSSLEWNLNANISLNRNRIEDIGTDSEGDGLFLTDDALTKCNYYLGDYIGSGRYFNAPANIFIEGQPIGLFYGLATDGIIGEGETAPGFTAGTTRDAGHIRYRDLDGDGVISEEDRTILGDPNPDFTFGFGTSLTWKRLTFSMAFNGSYGNDICNSNLNMMMDSGYTTLYNIDRRVVEDSWTPERPNAKYPQLGKYIPNEDSSQFTDLNIEDGSYLRLSSVSLSYYLPFRKGFVRNINLGASVRNVCVWTAYSGWDPEVSSFGSSVRKMGIDNGSYPSSRTFCFDVKFTF